MKSSTRAVLGLFTVFAGCSAVVDNGGSGVSSTLTAGDQIYNYGTLVHPGACLDASGSGTANGTQIQEWWCNGSGAQSWELEAAGDQSFYLINTHANKCLDVNGAGTANGTKVQLWDCNGGGAQRFWVTPAANGTVMFVNQNANKCLDVAGANPADGTKVQLWDCNGTNAQLWNPAVIGTVSGGGTSAPPSGWTLTWSDEFNGARGAIDGSKWGFDTGNSGWGNNELEYYTNRTDNALVDGAGNLQIIAKKESYGGSNYTSARITTAGKFTQAYGRIEARIKIPSGQGIWPAFWMLGSNIGSVGWPTCGEIDIMEAVINFSVNHGTIHGPGYSGGAGPTGTYQNNGSLANDFHIYAVEWDTSQIRWYVDGNLYETRSPADANGNNWVFNHPFYVLLNVAVGGTWPGNPDGSTSFPQTMLVDYVRVYSR
jgi:beta-glucanase (GH16 family)